MAGKVANATTNMLSSIGAIQTLTENFPMNLFSFGGLKFATSFDVLSILFNMLGVDREELIDEVTNILCGDMKDTSDGSGFISKAEEIVKIALEANLTNLLNCTTDPIISNNLLDFYKGVGGVDKSGEGLSIKVSEIDFTGVLNRNPLTDEGNKFYFDVENKDINNLYTSKDFNAYLWYIINKSDKSQKDGQLIWDDRYKSQLYKKQSNGKKIIKCTYIDEEYPKTDEIVVQLCNETYYKTRKLSKKDNNGEWKLNKTVFEFNHDFLTSVKLYEPKVIIAEIVEYLIGQGNITLNLGFSLNEEIIKGKVDKIISKIIEADDLEVEDCYFTFSNEEYDEMLRRSEENRYNVINNGEGYYEVNPNDILKQLSTITSESNLIEDKSVIKKTVNDIIAIYPAQDPSLKFKGGITYDWEFELIRALVYPFIRPLFTPKVLFLLVLNKKLMGSPDIKDYDINKLFDDLMNSLFVIIKDIIIKLKNLLVEMLLNFMLEKLKPLLALFASRMLLESLKMYKDLLEQIMSCFRLYGAGNRNKLVGYIDDVNYADIEVIEQTQPNQTMC